MYCPQCGNEYEGSPTHCVHCGRVFGERTAAVGVSRRPKAREWKRLLYVIAGVFLALSLAAGGVGLWFGGSGWEKDKWQGRYQALENENRGLENENNQVLSDYNGIREAVNFRLGHGDRKGFITPFDPSIGVEVEGITGSRSGDTAEMWADFYRLYDWVSDNIMYSFDSRLPILPDLPCNYLAELMLWKPDYWRLPSETLAERTGDCEDMATLLASMIINYTGGKYHCWVILLTSGDVGHAAVALPVAGGYLAILDPVGDYATGLGRNLTIPSAVDEWFEYLGLGSETYVSGVVTYTEGRIFATTDEFVEWAGDRM